MTLSCLFVMDLKGKVIICRNYRGDVPMTTSERFVKPTIWHKPLLTDARFSRYIQEKDEMDQRPIFTDAGYTFASIKVLADTPLFETYLYSTTILSSCALPNATPTYRWR